MKEYMKKREQTRIKDGKKNETEK